MAKNSKKNFLSKNNSEVRQTTSIKFKTTDFCKTCTCKPMDYCDIQAKLAKDCKRGK